MAHLRWVLPALIWAVVEPRAGADELHTRFFRDTVLGSGGHWQYWSGEGNLSLREISVPVNFIWPVSSRLSIDLATGSGFAQVDRGASNSLKGLTDTKVRVSYIAGEEKLLLTAGVNTPTGRTELDGEEQLVSAFLAQNVLGFRAPNFGQGLDISLGAATAARLGETVWGLGVGYLLKGEFTPLEGGADYTPGSELSLTAGLDRKIMDGDGKLTLDMVYTLYGEDELGGEKIFQSGSKILVRALGRFRPGATDWQMQLVERSKAPNTQLFGVFEEEVSNGNQLEGKISALRRLSPRWSLGGRAEAKLYGDNDFGRGEASLFGLGPGLRYTVAPGTFFDLNGAYSLGTIDGADVWGIDIGGSIWIRL